MLPAKLRSKWWRLTHLYKIKDKNGNLVTFSPNIMQQKNRLDEQNHKYVYIVKPRQFGFTTDHVIDMLDDALWIPGMSCAIVAHDRETLTKIFAIIKRAFDDLPAEIKPLTKYDTRNEYRFEYRYDGVRLDSEIYVALKLRGTTVKRLHISEAAYNKDRGELKRGAKQAVPIGGRIVEETTGNGMDEFYDDVMAALEKQKSGPLSPMDYKVCFYSWVENPEYSLPGVLPEEMRNDEERRIIEVAKREFNIDVTDGQLLWRRWKLIELRSRTDGVSLNTEQQFKQEYPLTLLEAFQSAMGNVFDLSTLEHMQGTKPLSGIDVYRYYHPAGWDMLSAYDQNEYNRKYKEWQALDKLGVRFWELPQRNKRYVLGCDPSDGTGGDNADIDVWPMDQTDGKIIQCAQFFGQMRPDLLAHLNKMIAEFYNDAFAGVENNMLSTVLFLKDIYDNIYTEVRVESKTQKRTLNYGINTNGKTRNPMIDEYIQLYEDDGLIINSSITISQMRTFVTKENGKREHADGKSDDALFGAFIALQMRKHQPPRGRTFAKKPAGL